MSIGQKDKAQLGHALASARLARIAQDVRSVPSCYLVMS